MNSKKESIFTNVSFKNLSNCSDENYELTGAVNFYNTKIKLYNINFINNLKGDDYVNIVNSNFVFENIYFKDSFLDSLDIDYSDGNIKNLTAINSKNDALDLSNSEVIIEKMNISNSGDKGISVGEKSILKGNNLIIDKSFVGLAIKDSSDIYLSDIIIKNSKYAIAAYKKKNEYSQPTGVINNLLLDNNITNYLIESNTNIIINKSKIDDLKNNVYKKLYN